jgi:uncharacterized protein
MSTYPGGERLEPTFDDITMSIGDAIVLKHFDEALRLLAEHPEALNAVTMNKTWLHHAAWQGDIELVKFLVVAGLDVNAPGAGSGEDGPLWSAVCAESVDVVQFLLEHGADPNRSRMLISAINADTNELAMVKLLVEHGADVNRSYPFGGKDGPIFNALSWAEASGKTEIAEYLRSKGAVPPSPKPKNAPTSREDEIIARFEKQFGAVRPGALREIVPTGLPIAIHAIPPSKTHNQLTLFTTGMSEQAMNVPGGQEDYRYAELLMHLPSDWPLTKKLLSDPEYNWPVRWLQETARFPHDNKTWLGGPFTIIAKDPPQKIPGTNFTAMMLAAKGDMRSADGRLVQLYTLVPLYPEERQLELKKGLPALMRALDKFNISDVVNPNRVNVALAAK